MEPIYVHFLEKGSTKIDKTFIGTVVNLMNDWCTKNTDPNVDDLLTTILIVRSGATAIARKSLAELGVFSIEIFSQEELLVNITKHELVPQHYIISDSEKTELLKKYRVRDSQLPKI